MNHPFDIRHSTFGLCFLLLIGLSPFPLHAHDGPEETIKHLTERIDQKGYSPLSLYQRATEYRALGQLALAAKDLEHAIQLHQNYIPAIAELSQVYLALNKPGDALRMIDRTLILEVKDSQRSGFQLTRASILRSMERNDEALQACAAAFLEGSPDPDRYLLRSEIQASLGQHASRVEGLKEGFDKSGSGVLEEEWIEAMIDARQYPAALRSIEEHLNRSRWQSAWLLRRARIRQGLGSKEAAQQDLQAAIEEINQRLNPDQPDLFLLADRGLCHALAGNKEAAGNDLALAQATGAHQWVVRRLQKALE